MSNDEPLPVEFDELLAAEFDYIAQTAAQATKDRARAVMFFFLQAFFRIGLFHWVISVLMGGLTMFLQLRIYNKS